MAAGSHGDAAFTNPSDLSVRRLGGLVADVPLREDPGLPDRFLAPRPSPMSSVCRVQCDFIILLGGIRFLWHTLRQNLS
jgi:hypothetical protein